MIFLPECFDYIGTSREESLALSDTDEGVILTRYRELAKKLGVWLSLGGMHEKVCDRTHFWNFLNNVCKLCNLVNTLWWIDTFLWVWIIWSICSVLRTAWNSATRTRRRRRGYHKFTLSVYFLQKPFTWFLTTFGDFVINHGFGLMVLWFVILRTIKIQVLLYVWVYFFLCLGVESKY